MTRFFSVAGALEFPFRYMQTVSLRFSRARAYARVSCFAKKTFILHTVVVR